ncbi:MAG: GTP-binding protein [Sodaliphilus sp.]|jgi:G3E family GTPase|nr:GTP-binding protein [Sodaliphilus sp.]
MKINNIPVLLLTGYLGSGKTTLVNHILANEKGIKFAVIVNDIGEVNIDANLIEKGGIVGKKDDSLVALQNGCICCTLKMDLVQQLRDITKLKKFDYIVIEASGICEPAPIAQTICSIPTMVPEAINDGAYPNLDCIVTVVDALRMKDEFKSGGDLMRQNIDEDDIESLLIQQIEFCNIVLLNKASEVQKDDLERIKEIIRALQPKAEIIECDYGNVDLGKIVNTKMFDFDKVATSATWINEIESHHDEEEEHGGEVEEYGIGTYVYCRRPAFDINRFDDFVSRKWPKNVIRAKGICYFNDERETCYVFEQAGKQVNLKNAGQWYATMPHDELEKLLQQDATLRRDWDEKYGDRMQKLVFIGQHLDKAAIEKALDECLEVRTM